MQENPQTSNGVNVFAPHVPEEAEAMILPEPTRNTALQQAQQFTITGPQERAIAKEHYDNAKRRLKVLDDARLEIGRENKQFLDKLLERIGITPGIAYYKSLIGIYEPKMRTFDTEVERLRKEEEVRLQAKAREEADRLRREAQERQRKADEAAAKLRAEAEAQRKAQEEAERRAREANDQVARREAEKAAKLAAEKAAKLDARADAKVEAGQERAQELTMKADMVPVPTIESQDDRPTRWGAELDVATFGDEGKALDALIAAAADGNLLARQMICFDSAIANKLGLTLKSNLKVPGVRAVEKPFYVTKHRG